MPATRNSERRSRSSLTPVFAFACMAAAAALAYSCATTTRTILAPPDVPGAEYLGSEACADCHDEIVARFAGATHDLLHAEGENGQRIGCEACHGPGSLHYESGGETAMIVNPEKSPEPCFRCHLNTRGDFGLPHAHPVTGGPLALTTGKITCTDCHQVHEGPALASGGTSVHGRNELCTGCHPAQRGPFVFEHEALREGCTVCHTAHGSVNDKMLSERDATLCLKCHFQEQLDPTTIVIGGRDHSALLSRGTCFSAGCHEAVHGSQVSSSLRF